MAQVTDAPVRWLPGALANLEGLKAEGRLPPDREGWIGVVRAELARHGWRSLAAQ
jgi:hypothetical protein